MLPSSYTRRLRTQDLIQHKLPELPLPTPSPPNTFTRVSFLEAREKHSYLPKLLRERTSTHHSSRITGQIRQVLEHMSDIDKKLLEEEAIYKKKLNAAIYTAKRITPTSPAQISSPTNQSSLSLKSCPTITKVPPLQFKSSAKVSKTPSTVLTETVSLKSKAVTTKDKLAPPKLEKQRSRNGNLSRDSKLLSIKEDKEEKSNSFSITRKTIKAIPKAEIDTKENLTHDRMISLVKALLRDKKVSQCYSRNESRIGLLTPVVCEGTPAWSQEVKSSVFILAPVRSLCFIRLKYKYREVGYIEVDLPRKAARAKKDIYEQYRSEDGKHLSSSKLNRAFVDVFMEALELAKSTGEFKLLPDLNFDYLNDTLELVYTKYLRIPIIPTLYVGKEEPFYVMKPNIPDIDPTSDTLFRVCYLAKEENILRKITTTDHGLRIDALKVIYTLCKQDWRLQALSVYQLKNVLMHDIDFEIDNSPRWQRLTRDICVQSVLKRLLYFVQKRNLPHFFQSNFNLFCHIPEKALKFMETPLERLISNEPQLLRDLKRASRSNNFSDTSSDSDEDWW